MSSAAAAVEKTATKSKGGKKFYQTDLDHFYFYFLTDCYSLHLYYCQYL